MRAAAAGGAALTGRPAARRCGRRAADWGGWGGSDRCERRGCHENGGRRQPARQQPPTPDAARTRCSSPGHSALLFVPRSASPTIFPPRPASPLPRYASMTRSPPRSPAVHGRGGSPRRQVPVECGDVFGLDLAGSSDGRGGDGSGDGGGDGRGGGGASWPPPHHPVHEAPRRGPLPRRLSPVARLPRCGEATTADPVAGGGGGGGDQRVVGGRGSLAVGVPGRADALRQTLPRDNARGRRRRGGGGDHPSGGRRR